MLHVSSGTCSLFLSLRLIPVSPNHLFSYLSHCLISVVSLTIQNFLTLHSWVKKRGGEGVRNGTGWGKGGSVGKGRKGR